MTEKDYAPQKSESKKMVVNAPKKASDKTPIMKEKKTKKVVGKIILVDAVHCLVDEEGKVNQELKKYLDSLENKKIILTNAPKEKYKIFFKNIKDYEIFTLENNPNKKNPEYYKKFLEQSKLNPKEVIYFEHDPESVKSAKSVGIKTIQYDNNLNAIKKFVEENTKEEKPTDKEVKTEDKKETEKKPIQTKPKIKKTEAIVNSLNLPISTKHSKAVCKFIKGKKIENAINDLEKVIVQKKPVPMKGEIPHRKGIMSGRYPKKAAQHFIKLLKSLSANANLHEIENPIIKESIANIGSRPYGKFGRVRRKRTHIKITVMKKINEVKK